MVEREEAPAPAVWMKKTRNLFDLATSKSMWQLHDNEEETYGEIMMNICRNKV